MWAYCNIYFRTSACHLCPMCCQMRLLRKPDTLRIFTVSLYYSDISILTVFTNRKYAFAVLRLKKRMKSAPSTIVVTMTAKGSGILTKSHSHDESLRDSIGGRCRARNDQCDEGDRRCTAPSTETQDFEAKNTDFTASRRRYVRLRNRRIHILV